MLSYALQELEKGNITKIVIVPNNSRVDGTRELAALPGGIFEKELSYTAALIDLLGIDRLRNMVEKEQIEILPMAVARGRNLVNSIVFVNESQNLTSQHVQLLIGRIGNGSRIFFDGDWAQTDQKMFRNDSGIRQVNKLAFTQHARLFGTVQLKSIARSETARLAEVLSKL
jgi:predicted ribonuclease YlaK